MMEGIRFERMRKRHLSEVLRIERVSFGAPWSEVSFMSELYNPASVAYVALAGSSVAGYIIVRQIVDEGHILNLAVRPDLRRKGIARALVENAMADLRESLCKYIYLEVRASNEEAKKLYEALGFKIVGTRKAYYENPREDALLMTSEMKPR